MENFYEISMQILQNAEIITCPIFIHEFTSASSYYFFCDLSTNSQEEKLATKLRCQFVVMEYMYSPNNVKLVFSLRHSNSVFSFWIFLSIKNSFRDC